MMPPPDGRARPRLPARAARHATFTDVSAEKPQELPWHEALVVIVETPAGRERRRCFLSLHGATAAVERARAAGQPVSLVLCRLVRVVDELPVVSGLDADEDAA